MNVKNTINTKLIILLAEIFESFDRIFNLELKINIFHNFPFVILKIKRLLLNLLNNNKNNNKIRKEKLVFEIEIPFIIGIEKEHSNLRDKLYYKELFI